MLITIVWISQLLLRNKIEVANNPEYRFPTRGSVGWWSWAGLFRALSLELMGYPDHTSLVVTPEHKRACPLPGSLLRTSLWPKQVSGQVQG